MRLLAFFAAFNVLQLFSGPVDGSRSVESAYDSNKNVFSPQGRLVQLDYVEGLVQRGNLCMGVECKDGVVLMTDKLVTADAARLLVDGGVRRIYKVDSHIGVLPAGLPADGRALAHKAMEYCRSHRRAFGEPIPGRLLAERLGEFLHGACVRWGSRAYPNALFVACWGAGAGGMAVAAAPPGREAKKGAEERGALDDGGGAGEVDQQEEGEGGAGWAADRDAGFQLYVVDPGGASRRHRAACTGRGSSRARKWLHRRSVEAAAAPGATTGQEGDTSGGSGSERVGEDAAIGQEKEEGGGGSRAFSAEPLPSPSAGDLHEEEEEEEGNREDSEDSEEEDDDGLGERRASRDRSRGGHRKVQGRGHDERRCRRHRHRLPWSQMTCVEAARALVREAKRLGTDERGKAGAASPGSVASFPEVAWLTTAEKTGRDGEVVEAEPVFVHHRSMEDLA